MAELEVRSAIQGTIALGAQVSNSLYNLTLAGESTNKHVIAIAQNIVEFCSVLQQLSTILGQPSSLSGEAISGIQEILNRSLTAFRTILGIITKLLRFKAEGDFNSSPEKSKRHNARLRSVYSQAKIQRIRAELESMKLTTHLMVVIVTFSQDLLLRRISNGDPNAEPPSEDLWTSAIAASLIIALKYADESVDDLDADVCISAEVYELLEFSDDESLKIKENVTQPYRASVLIFGNASKLRESSSQQWRLNKLDDSQLFVYLLKRWANCDLDVGTLRPASPTVDVMAKMPLKEQLKPRAPIAGLTEAQQQRNDYLGLSVAEAIRECETKASTKVDGMEPSMMVDLGNRNLREIPRELLAISQTVNRLSLSWNSLDHFKVPEKSFPALTYLNMRSNLLKEFPSEITKITTLEILDLGKNEIQTLPLELHNLQKLKVLAVPRNRISIVPLVLGRLNNLVILKVEGNPFLDAAKFRSIRMISEEDDELSDIEYTSRLKEVFAIDEFLRAQKIGR